MKWRKRIYYNPVYMFLFYFVFYTLAIHTISFREQSFLDSILEGIFFSVWMIFFFLFFYHPHVPVYFKLGYYDQLIEELKKEGAVLISEKKDKLFFKVPKRSFPFNRIRVKKTPFYACLEVPERDHDHYLNWVQEQGAGLYEKKV